MVRGDTICTIRSTGLETVLDAGCPTSGNQCDSLHATSLNPDEPRGAQEWTLIRFPFTSLPPRPSLLGHRLSPSLSAIAPTLPRRTLRLQNVSSGLYATFVVGRGERPNIGLRAQPSPDSDWTFIHTMHVSANPDMFAIAAASPHVRGTIDHWGASHINVNKYWPNNRFHGWVAIPRDGVFLFRNCHSGKLLCQSNKMVVDTMVSEPLSMENPICQWRLVDSETGELCHVLYDSALTILPPDIAGPTPVQKLPAPAPSPGLTLRTTPATDEMHLNFFNSLQPSHEMIRYLLKSGCSALVVAPGVLTAWRLGSVSRIKLSSEPAEYDVDTLVNGHPSRRNRKLDPCKHS